MLEIKKITKVYKTGDFSQKALDEITVNFRQNEFVSILGPSGSGKTTLLNIIGGLDRYTSGDLVINGISTKNYKDRDFDSYRNHRVGFVFQSYNLIPHQSVLSNVELALTLSGVSKKIRRKKAKEVLEKVGLKDHINKRPNQLSGGQMQRVAIARALINDPDILLADEPTGALDTETSKQIMEILKEIAKDKLVIMVTHNPDLAKEYSTRIVKVLDGRVIEDTNPFDGKDEIKEESKRKTKKTSMNYLTALSLSLNNLMTKKGRTILTAFAGSIGIIGIALIMSLSNGITMYINKTEKETLSSYPLTIAKESVDLSTVITSLSASSKSEKIDDNKIHSLNIMGDMFKTFSKEVKVNDLKKFGEYLKTTDIKKYSTDVKYSYDLTLNLYKVNNNKIVRVNPTTVLDTIGMKTDGVSSVYSSYMSNYDVFYEILDNDKLNKQQYDLLAGSWPKEYNELVIQVDKNNRISDYTLYSLGILDQDHLKQQFNNMITGKSVEFDDTSYEYSDLIGLTYKLVLSSEYYKKSGNVWIDMSNDQDYIKNIVNNGIDVKIVGIIRPNEEAVVVSPGMVGYTHKLVEYYIEKNSTKQIVKEQLENKNVNVFTNQPFSSSFDMSSLSEKDLLALQNMSEQELMIYMQNMNNMSSTYEENLKKLGIAFLDEPSTINIYPVDFDGKEQIVKIIDNYNKDKSEDEKITYSDIVGVMMSSVSTIVDVISKVLIAFVSISLVVSSIMIAIITYISVIERTKEIGILRAIGASKKDVSRVFNAETLIEGFVSGIFGIFVTLLLNIPINIIIKKVVNISNISVLPVKGAIVLVLISMLLTLIAGLIPSKIASRKDPVEALRTE